MTSKSCHLKFSSTRCWNWYCKRCPFTEQHHSLAHCFCVLILFAFSACARIYCLVCQSLTVKCKESCSFY